MWVGQMWDTAVLVEDQFIGEASFNLAKFFKDTVENKKSKALFPRETVKFVHSNWPGEKLVKPPLTFYFFLFRMRIYTLFAFLFVASFRASSTLTRSW